MPGKDRVMTYVTLFALAAAAAFMQTPAAAQNAAAPIVVQESALLDAIEGPVAIKPAAAGNKLLWVKLFIRVHSESLRSIPLSNIRAVGSDKSEWKVAGYYLGNSRTPMNETFKTPPGEYNSVDSRDGLSTYTMSEGKETLSVNGAPTVVSLAFEVPANATLAEVRGFGPASISAPAK